ncbi:hypothetical protein BU26DRAFT_30816 [Trematosphaeria pertusa]|uniref:Uncharacterized protein n=1 Tax=Trematosphaeria pertusa TaxID=390896 RepID=A0A6A6J3D8_9PLEO|nr:uncharacterized protein BU26DRAFT_30816 [Trematosphaeria pertusa]KAF2256867.1 hypothetical protein BU26DRAFT_30816 [Trematosphaeria pertusa]
MSQHQSHEPESPSPSRGAGSYRDSASGHKSRLITLQAFQAIWRHLNVGDEKTLGENKDDRRRHFNPYLPANGSKTRDLARERGYQCETPGDDADNVCNAVWARLAVCNEVSRRYVGHANDEKSLGKYCVDCCLNEHVQRGIAVWKRLASDM